MGTVTGQCRVLFKYPEFSGVEVSEAERNGVEWRGVVE